MKKLLSLLLILVSYFSYAQNSYELAAGQDYWKNRKPHAAYWQQDVHYKINATINDVEESIAGEEHLTYYNNSPDTLYSVYFHLYQNAFQPNSYAHELRKQGKLATTFGVHELEGKNTLIQKVTINGSTVSFSIDNTIMRIDLPSPLMPKGKVDFEIEFKTYWDKDDGGNMRRRMKTFYHDGVTHFDGVHWYPRIAVYDRKFGWTTDQHMGKEFYGDFGLFEVELTFPNQYVVEATGELTNREEVLTSAERDAIDIKNYKAARSELTQPIPANGTTKTWKYRAVNVHDFAFTADPSYRIGEAEYNGVQCIALVQEPHAHRWQQTATYLARIIQIYSEEIGAYAYPKIVAADARDGMEYPMLTLNNGNWPGHAYLIAHEVGHNWFFGMVGNNETYRSGLDEGFTQFLTAMSLKKINRQDFYNNSIDQSVVFNSYLSHAANENSATLNVHADHYNSAERHGGGYSQVYYKTATMLYNLQYVLGDALFSKTLKNYFSQWQYCHPYWHDFRESVIRYTKVDLNWFFDQWLTTTKTIDYGVGKVWKEGEDQFVEIQRKGEMQMPLDVQVVFKDGSVQNYYIPNTVFEKNTEAIVAPRWIGWDMVHPTYKLKVQHSAKIKEVHIDPSGRLADINRLNNFKKTPVDLAFSGFRLTPDNYEEYRLRWHPMAWYNAVDGIKLGVNVAGRSHSDRHALDMGIWYNSGQGATDDAITPAPVHYSLSYTHRVGQMLNLNLDLRYLEGLEYYTAGLERRRANHSIGVTVKAMRRANNRDMAYLLNPELWTEDAWNNTLNLHYMRSVKYQKARGQFQLAARGSFVGSDHHYAYVNSQYIHTQNIRKTTLRLRGFGQIGSGTMAPESQLMLAGGNAEERMENAWMRSKGILPAALTSYSYSAINTVHYEGGLNLRGFNGVLATQNVEGQVYAVHAGNSGAALNAELDFTRVLGARSVSKWMNLYAFGDAGYLYADAGSGLRADAGVGCVANIRFKRYNAIKPLSIRLDLPLFVNRIPADALGTQHWDLRYLLGVNRSF